MVKTNSKVQALHTRCGGTTFYYSDTIADLAKSFNLPMRIDCQNSIRVGNPDDFVLFEYRPQEEMYYYKGYVNGGNIYLKNYRKKRVDRKLANMSQPSIP